MTSGKVLRSLQIAFAIVAVAVIQARADIIDLGGETVAITTDNGLNTYKNHEVRNGVLNVSAKQGFADGTFTSARGSSSTRRAAHGELQARGRWRLSTAPP